MLCVQQQGCPLDYSHCNQTVTIYHQNAPGDYARTVYAQVFLDFQKNRSIDKTGSKDVNGFLLVLPTSDAQAVRVGDKVMLGEGPAVSTREEWAALLPSKWFGLAVVGQVDVKFWRGEVCHIEAGGAG